MVTRNNLNTYITPDANNQVLKPAQPAFLAIQLANQMDETGDGTIFILGDTDVGAALTEIFDQNSDFVTGSSDGAIFTAPVTGRYYLSMGCYSYGYDGSQTEIVYNIQTSNGDYTPIRGNPTNIRDNTAIIIFLGGCLCDMDVADTVKVTVNATGGNKTVDIHGGASSADKRTSFSGYLVV